jgi:hypothetical protein
VERDGRHPRPLRELPADERGLRVGDRVRLLLPEQVVDLPVLAAAGLDRQRRAELQDLEDLEEGVVPHVAEGAGAEVVPPAKDGVRVGQTSFFNDNGDLTR